LSVVRVKGFGLVAAVAVLGLAAVLVVGFVAVAGFEVVEVDCWAILLPNRSVATARLLTAEGINLRMLRFSH